MKFKLKYGSRHQLIYIPDKTDFSILRAAKLPILKNAEAALENALAHPIGCQAFENMVRAIRPRKVSIAVPDETRPVPIKMILPVLLRRLNAALAGFDPAAVTVVIGGGLHPPLESEALRRILPPAIFEDCRVVAHDAVHSRMIDFGVTLRGTPVRINAEFAEADFKIAIGQIDPHQFVGFTGGAKGVSIGCAAPESIEHNHSLMSDQKAQVGVLKGNPVREDMIRFAVPAWLASSDRVA